MKKYLILFISLSAFLSAHCGGCGIGNDTNHIDLNQNEISSIIMNELYGNYNVDTKKSSRSEDKYDNAKFEGSLSYNDKFYIAIISIDNGYNQGLSVYQITFTIKNSSPVIINPLEEIRVYPNRFKSSLNELVEIEFGKENQKKNIGFKVISQYGRSGENIGLLAIFDNKLQIVLDNISYSYDGNRNCDYEDRNGEIFIDNKPFLEWKNNSEKWKGQELTEEDVRFMWVKCSGKSISEVNIVESGKLFNDIKIGKNIYSFLNDSYQIRE